MANISVTQAAVILINYTVFYFIILLGLGPVVDCFVYDIALDLPLTPWGQEMMQEIIIFGQWFYWVLKAILAMVVLWVFIYIIRRHRYTRELDEGMYR